MRPIVVERGEDVMVVARLIRMRRCFAVRGGGLIAPAALALWGCTGARLPRDSAAGEPTYRPRFEKVACPTDPVVMGILFDDSDQTCGYLVVPQDRDDPDGPTVRDFV